MDIRDAAYGDVPVLARLIRDSFRDVAERFSLTPDNCSTHPSFCTEEWVSSALDKGNRFFLARAEEGPCGCVALEEAGPDVCYLERLAVLPPYRRRGYGRMLVEHVAGEARDAGASRLEIGIIAEQEELREWYVEAGFAEMGRKRFEHLPFEVLFMARELNMVPGERKTG